MKRSFKDRSARVLIVDDDAAHRIAVRRAVEQMHRPEIHPYLAESLQHAIEILEREDIDVCLCDYQLWGEATAMDLLTCAQSRGVQIPFVAITGVVAEDPLAHELLVSGFEDVLHKDELKDANLYRLIRNGWLRNQRARDLEENASREPLTGLHNRRSLESRLQLDCDRMNREISNLAVMFLDLNGFKPINDHYGHAAGDEALKRVAEVILKSVRKTDLVARIGGDEFVVVLPNCQPEMLTAVSDKIREKVEQTTIRFEDFEFRVGTSIGCAMYDKDTGPNTPESLIKAADAAMYTDKQSRQKNIGLTIADSSDNQGNDDCDLPLKNNDARPINQAV